MRKLLTLILFVIASYGLFHAQITLPYAEDLESENTGGTGCGNAQVFTSIDWTNELNDDVDWVIDINGTTSSSTGPTANGGADHNPGIGGGRYLYIEASGCVTDTANLVSDEIITTGNEPNIFFEFWYHQYGAQININILQIREVVNGNPQAWVSLDTLFTPPPGLDQWQQGLYDLSPYIGDTFQLRFRGVTGTSFGSDNALDDFNIYSLFPNDAGVISIDAPMNAVMGANPVDVTIQNFGADTLTNVDIIWELNGGAPSTFNWTGSLANSQQSASTNIGTANITTELFSIKAYTSMPNMAIDSNNTNDTTMIFGCTGPLSGNYTVGGPGADFPDVESLGDVLSTCGIDSHTVILINPGVYQERLVLDHVPGTDTNATLLITGGDTSLVTIDAPAFSAVFLDGTDYTTIKNLTLQSLGNSDAYGVQLRDTASWNVIDSCRILLSPGTGLADVIGVSASSTETSSFSEGQNALWTTVSNCHILGGEKGIHFEGANALRNVGNRFLNNLIEDAEDYGFYIDDQDSIQIIGNTIVNLRNGNADAFNIFDVQMFDISENEAFDVPDFGINMDDANFSLDGTPTSRGRIINNMISSLTDHAAEFDDFENTDIWHNTFANVSTFSEAVQINDFTGLDVRNNIFYSDGNFALEADDLITNTTNTFDHNLYFVDNFANVVEDGNIAYADLTAWQTASPALNANSVEDDPVFLGGLSDLHVLSPAPNDAGDSLGIMIDIDGDARPAGTAVDIGADEFTPVNDDAVAVEILAPGGGCGDSLTTVTVEIRNIGVVDITNLPITVNYSGTASGTLSFTYTDTLGFNENDTVDVGTINTYNGGTYTFNGYVSLAGDADVANDTFPELTAEFISIPPIGISGVGCGVDSAYISGFPYSGVSYFWYANINDTTPVAVGDSFLVPSISTQSTYFLEYANNADSLPTFYNSNNGAGGNMWDVTATNTVTITQIAGNFDTGTTVDVEIWWRPNGTFQGNENNQNNDWILLGTATGVPSAGTDIPTLLPVTFSATIPAGQTVGFFMNQTNGSSVNYTNGTAVGAPLTSNADISITQGVGRSGGGFGASIFSPRNWNGTMYYGSTACSGIRTPVSAISTPAPSVDLGVDTVLCGTSIVLDAGNPGFNYDWSNGDSTQTSTVTMSGTYSVEVFDTFGCDDSDTIDVVLNTPPTVNLGGDFTLCDGASATLDAGNPDAASWVWSSGGSAQTEPVSMAGVISVIVTDTNGCTGDDSVTVTTGQTPVPNFSAAISGAGLVYDFTDLSTGTPTAWLWDFGDGNSSTAQNPTHTYAAPGSYTVQLTAINACGTVDTTISFTVVGVDQLLGEGVVDLYPNPNNGIFKLEFSGMSTTSPIEYRVLDAKGQIVMESSTEQQGSFIEELDMTRFATGMYMMQVSADGDRVMLRFVVE